MSVRESVEKSVCNLTFVPFAFERSSISIYFNAIY